MYCITSISLGKFKALFAKLYLLSLSSSGNLDAHIVQFDREHYKAPNLVKLLSDQNIIKIFHYGRADMAQGGGTQPEKLSDALNSVKDLIKKS